MPRSYGNFVPNGATALTRASAPGGRSGKRQGGLTRRMAEVLEAEECVALARADGEMPDWTDRFGSVDAFGSQVGSATEQVTERVESAESASRAVSQGARRPPTLPGPVCRRRSPGFSRLARSGRRTPASSPHRGVPLGGRHRLRPDLRQLLVGCRSAVRRTRTGGQRGSREGTAERSYRDGDAAHRVFEWCVGVDRHSGPVGGASLWLAADGQSEKGEAAADSSTGRPTPSSSGRRRTPARCGVPGSGPSPRPYHDRGEPRGDERRPAPGETPSCLTVRTDGRPTAYRDGES